MVSSSNLLEFYKKESHISGVPVIIMGTISGIAQSFILGIITVAADSASHENLNFQYFLLFAIAFAIMIIGKRYTLRRARLISEDIIKNIRVRITNKIRNSELLFLENLGKGELYSRLANDTTLLSSTSLGIIDACQSAIIVLFCLLFVAFISKAAFFITIIATAIATLHYLTFSGTVYKELGEALNKESKFFAMINQILNGFKELKVNRKKNDDYFGFFTKLASETKDLKVRIGFRFITAMMYSQVFFYLLLGIIVFIMPRFEQVNPENILRIAAAILFIIGPLSSVVGSISYFSQANAAIGHLYALEEELDAASKAYKPEGELPVPKIESFDKITLESISFSYTDQYNMPLFTVGPLDLSIKQGEIIFLIGGNGSGKTTLLKLLTGLYYPDIGTIKIDDIVITKATYQAYRELFSIIFMDFHLFDRLYGLDVIDPDKINALLQLMELDKKTDLIDGEFSNIQLSTGQCKRLALIVALLDDRPIYVFDEWAADQDPNFRKYFYEELVYQLRDQGKTIIAVSHDDRYFHVADRVFKMDYGQFVNMETA